MIVPGSTTPNSPGSAAPQPADGPRVTGLDGHSGFREDGVDVHLDADGKPRMVERRFAVEKEYAGWRVDHFLKHNIPRLSRTKLQRIIRTQVLPVRGRQLKPHSPVAVGDVVTIRHPARPEPPCPRRFGVLYRDSRMMCIRSRTAISR